MSFISATPGGRSSTYQGCFWISGMVMRFSGLSTRILLSKSRQGWETLSWEGKSYSTFKILCSSLQIRTRLGCGERDRRSLSCLRNGSGRHCSSLLNILLTRSFKTLLAKSLLEIGGISMIRCLQPVQVWTGSLARGCRWGQQWLYWRKGAAPGSSFAASADHACPLAAQRGSLPQA